MSSSPPAPREYIAFGRPDFSAEEIAAVSAVLQSGWVGMGPETIAFEGELATYLAAPHAITVNSCSSALFLSLLVLGVGSGDEVICPSLTWCATANAALYLGAKPVFCDIDPATMSVTPDTVAAKLTPRTKAVMVVHYGGLAADVAAIRSVLPPGVAIVEDAAHALGARFANGRPVGSSGNLTCFSFYANKNLSTGDGGAISVFDDALAARLRNLRQSGMRSDAWKRYSNPMTALLPGLVELGYKMNFTDLQASIGRVQLRRQPEFKRRRLEITQRYMAALAEPGLGIGFQSGVMSDEHARHLLVITLPVERMRSTRDEFILRLRERNVGASIHYAPLHSMPLYCAEAMADLPKTDYVAQRIVTLPIGARLTPADADYVVRHVVEQLRA
jgi:dTDP-4-amino-4,6-dideoxygalactose transaminase